MIILDEQLRTGLSLLAEKKGNVYTLSKEFDVAHTTLAAWISGKTSKVKTSVFIKILQLLRDNSILSADACAEYGKKEGLIIPTTNRFVAAAASRRTADLLPDAPDPDQIDDALIKMFLAMPENAELRQDLLTRAKIACFKYLTNRGGVE